MSDVATEQQAVAEAEQRGTTTVDPMAPVATPEPWPEPKPVPPPGGWDSLVIV